MNDAEVLEAIADATVEARRFLSQVKPARLKAYQPEKPRSFPLKSMPK